MDESPERYADWKAPAGDGQVLIWPEPKRLLAETRDNQRRLSAAGDVLIQNTPLPDVRRRLRHWLGHADDSRPLIATGHQTELHHPGVWAKNALLDAAASALECATWHISVDTDAPKHLTLKWPGGGEPITDDATPAEWSGLLASPTPAHLASLTTAFGAAAAGWGFEPNTAVFFDAMRRLSLETPPLSAALANAFHEIDWSLGLRHHVALLSPLCHSPAYLLFAHHLLARAGEFAADYNAALNEYRGEQRIRDLGRPMPNLRVSQDECEAPFWLDSLGDGSRTRAAVTRAGSQWALRAPSGDAFTFDTAAEGWSAADRLARWLSRHNLRLAPRALTLTAVLRLLAADQFVHGIGGGRYDQVLDRLILRHFKLEPPRFAVTTATLYFPNAVGRQRACLPCVQQEGHRLKHAALGAEKMELVAAIDALPRGSRERGGLFQEMRRKIDVAALSLPELREWETRRAAAERQAIEERRIFDRELFYAIQPEDRLRRIIETYRTSFA